MLSLINCTYQMIDAIDWWLVEQGIASKSVGTELAVDVFPGLGGEEDELVRGNANGRSVFDVDAQKVVVDRATEPGEAPGEAGGAPEERTRE
jgi:hypothetical protein